MGFQNGYLWSMRIIYHTLPVCTFFLKYFLKGNTLGRHVDNMYGDQNISNLEINY